MEWGRVGIHEREKRSEKPNIPQEKKKIEIDRIDWSVNCIHSAGQDGH